MISGTPTREFRLPELKGGLNLRDLENKIDDDQSPDCLNVWYSDRVISKRWGQEYVDLTDTAGTAVTLSTVYSISNEFSNYKCIHAGTKLYKWDEENNQVTDLGVTTANVSGAFLEFNGYLYHMDGTEIRQIDTSYSCTAITPYVPTVYINCTPTLSSSDANEDYNLIGAGFKVTYNGDGTATYNLPLTSLDATEIVVKVGGVTKAKTTDYTWVALTGVVTFVGGKEPTTGTNNVEITAYKTVTGAKGKIAGCTVAIAYGGESSDIGGGSRAFLMKNSSYPQTYWYSDLGSAQGYGMTYFPDTQYEALIQNNESIQAAGKQGAELIIFKERSIFAVSYSFDGTDVFYPVREVNSSVGCDMPGSVQLIDNRLVFANTKNGVFMITNTSGEMENNVKPISGNINPGARGLLNETVANLKACTSIDYDRKYWLNVGTHVYLWDYELTPFYGYSDYEKAQRRLTWFKFDNIDATCFFGGTNLYYAYTTKLVRFINARSDFGSAITAYWKSKAFDFGLPDYLKTISRVDVSLRSDTNSNIDLELSNEEKEAYFTKELEVSNFSWAGFNWETFSWGVIKYAKPFKTKPKMKKIVYTQVKISNDENYRDVGMTDLTFSYFINGKIKR